MFKVLQNRLKSLSEDLTPMDFGVLKDSSSND